MPMGITDGSNALPGQVGEFYAAASNLSFQVGTLVMTVSVGTLPPGDWDAEAYMSVGGAVDEIMFLLTPVPPGFQNNMGSVWQFGTGALSIEGFGNAVPLGVPCRANTTVPTALVFQLTIIATTVGIATLNFRARRMR